MSDTSRFSYELKKADDRGGVGYYFSGNTPMEIVKAIVEAEKALDFKGNILDLGRGVFSAPTVEESKFMRDLASARVDNAKQVFILGQEAKLGRPWAAIPAKGPMFTARTQTELILAIVDAGIAAGGSHVSWLRERQAKNVLDFVLYHDAKRLGKHAHEEAHVKQVKDVIRRAFEHSVLQATEIKEQERVKARAIVEDLLEDRMRGTLVRIEEAGDNTPDRAVVATAWGEQTVDIDPACAGAAYELRGAEVEVRNVTAGLFGPETRVEIIAAPEYALGFGQAAKPTSEIAR